MGFEAGCALEDGLRPHGRMVPRARALTMPRALITGIAGQDGSYLAELLLAKGYDVAGVVRGSPDAPYPNLGAVRDDVELMQGDLLDQMTLLDAITRARPDELYNLAATSFVPLPGASR